MKKTVCNIQYIERQNILSFPFSSVALGELPDSIAEAQITLKPNCAFKSWEVIKNTGTFSQEESIERGTKVYKQRLEYTTKTDKSLKSLYESCQHVLKITLSDGSKYLIGSPENPAQHTINAQVANTATYQCAYFRNSTYPAIPII